MYRKFICALAVVLFSGAACDSSTEPHLTQLNLTVTGTGSGEVSFGVAGAAGGTCGAATTTSCQAQYSSSELLTMSAIADAGSVFAGWSGACTGTNACVIAMSASRTVTATFNLQ